RRSPSARGAPGSRADSPPRRPRRAPRETRRGSRSRTAPCSCLPSTAIDPLGGSVVLEPRGERRRQVLALAEAQEAAPAETVSDDLENALAQRRREIDEDVAAEHDLHFAEDV